MKDVPPTNSKSVKALNPHLYGGITSEGDQELERAAALTEEAGGVANELDLHNEIIKWCADHGWIAFHGSPVHRSYRTVGEFDFTILADRGRVLLIECKTRTGKLTKEQQALFAWATKNGHKPKLVRSFEQFLVICQELTSREGDMPIL